MSSNNSQSAVGRVGYRALTGEEVKEILIHEMTRRIRENPLIKKFLTFHKFKAQWAFRIFALADTPVPPEIEGYANITARDITDEEIKAIEDNIEALKAKRVELEPAVKAAKIIDEYLAKALLVIEEKGQKNDEGKPDIIRREVGLPILVTRNVGGRLAEVPEDTPETPTLPENIIQTPSPQAEEVKIDIQF